MLYPKLKLEIDENKITLKNPRKGLEFSCVPEITIDSDDIVTDIGSVSGAKGQVYKPLASLPLDQRHEQMLTKIIQHAIHELNRKKGGLFWRFTFTANLKVKLSENLQTLKQTIKNNAKEIGAETVEFI